MLRPSPRAYRGLLASALRAFRGSQRMMEKMMSAMVKPEDMPHMMGAMMDRMFSQMTSEDRIAFVSTMMPKCLSLIFAEIDPAAKEKLAREMMGKMVSILEGQIKQKPSS